MNYALLCSFTNLASLIAYLQTNQLPFKPPFPVKTDAGTKACVIAKNLNGTDADHLREFQELEIKEHNG